MARTITEIQTGIITDIVNEPTLTDFYNNSKLNELKLFIYIISSAIWIMENLFDRFKIEIDTKIANCKTPTIGWYRTLSLNFQYGFNLLPSGSYDNGSATEDQILGSKIITYSSVVRTDKQLLIKIAKNVNNNITKLEDNELAAFEAYINKIKAAGDKITCINDNPDKLKLIIHIIYDVMIITPDGINIQSGKDEVAEAIDKYLKNLPFDGEYSNLKLTDALQNVSGVIIPTIVKATVSNPEVVEKDVFNYIIPYSGYFNLDNLHVTYEKRI